MAYRQLPLKGGKETNETRTWDTTQTWTRGHSQMYRYWLLSKPFPRNMEQNFYCHFPKNILDQLLQVEILYMYNQQKLTRE